LNTSAFDIAYNVETAPTNNNGEYILNGKTILPATGAINKYTFTQTYRYFSDFYWKFIGDSSSDGLVNGMLYWYITEVL
jgi:hypothetical protein